MTNFTKLSLFVLAFAAVSCGDSSKEDEVNESNIDKDGAIETVLTTEHLDDTRDVLVTRYKIWKGGSLYTNVEHRDTLPALGRVTAQSESGTAASVQKDYEFFITVK